MNDTLLDSESSRSSSSLDELKKILNEKTTVGTLVCKRCNAHIWKLKLSPGSDFFILECRNCCFEQFVEFCDGDDE